MSFLKHSLFGPSIFGQIEGGYQHPISFSPNIPPHAEPCSVLAVLSTDTPSNFKVIRLSYLAFPSHFCDLLSFFFQGYVTFSPGAQSPLFGALKCHTMQEHDPSESHQHVSVYMAAPTVRISLGSVNAVEFPLQQHREGT